MSGTEAKAPDIKTEETLVNDDERIVLPETPALPPALETTLDRFVEALSLEDSGTAEFILGSALAATAETYGPSEAENLLRSFDQELTAEFFENLIEAGEIPQYPTMNNLLAGDVNSPAAQFILENLAAQSASGAFNTMQSTRRDSSYGGSERKRNNAASTAAYIQSMFSTADFMDDAYRILNATTIQEKVDIWKERYEQVLEEINNDPRFDDLTPEQRQELAMTITNEKTMDALTEAIMERNPGMSREDARAQAQEEMELIWAKIKEDPSLAPTILSSLQSLTNERDSLEELLATKEAERDQAKADLDTRIAENRSEAEAITDPVEREIALLALDSTSCPTPEALADQIREIMIKHGQVLPDGTPATPSEGSSNPLDFDPTINYGDVDNARVRELMGHYNGWAERDSEELYAEWDVNALQKQIDEIRAQITDLNQQIAELEAAGLADSTLVSDIKEQRDLYTSAEQQLSDQISNLETDVAAMAVKAEDFQAEKADAEFELTMAQFDRTTQALDLGAAQGNHESVAASLKAAGHATIRLRQVGDEFLPERDRGLLGMEFKLEGSAEDAVTYVVQTDENGDKYIDLGEEGRVSVTSWMEGYVSNIEGAHVELEGAQAEAYNASLHAVSVETAELSEADIAVQAAMAKISSVNALAIQRQGEVSELSTEKDTIQTQITAAAAKGLPTEHLQDRLDVLDQQIGNFNQVFTLSDSVYDFTASQYDFSLFDTTATDYSTDFGSSSLTMTDFSTDFSFDSDLTLGTTPALDLGSSSLLNTDLFGTTQNDPFSLDYNFDFGLDFTYDFASTDNFLLDDSFMAELDKIELYLNEMDTTQVSSDLSSIQADLEAELTALKMEMIADAGVPPELQEAFMKDLDVSVLGGVCVNLTHVKEELGIEAFSIDKMDMNSLFNASAEQSENEILAQRLQMAADQLGVGEKGDRYRAIVEQLEELTGEERQVVYAGETAGTEAENLTLEAPTIEEMTREAQLANEARNYADQVRSNGVVTERDLEDAFPGLSPQEMDLVKAEMVQEGIEVKPVEELTPDEKPQPTDREVSFANAATPTEIKPMTLGA